MDKKYIYILLIGVSSFISILSFGSFISNDNKVGSSEEEINLAIRDAAHQLQLIAGDSKSTIPPVEVQENEFSLKFNQQLNYDTLPDVLSKSFKAFGIENDYRVIVRNCFQDQIILGYTKISLESEQLACKDRDFEQTCSIVSVIIEKPQEKNLTLLLTIPALILLAFSSILLFSLLRNKQESSEEKNHNNLGNFLFDHENQKLILDQKEITLTFRESKLLSFLFTNKNQLINRENILENVWGDEGVMVGRSLDVFISRLRKKLAGDDQVEIKNVHGVGYKLVCS